MGKLYNVVALFTSLIEVFLPLPELLMGRWIRFVPFRSPTLSMAYHYFVVRDRSRTVLRSDAARQVVSLQLYNWRPALISHHHARYAGLLMLLVSHMRSSSFPF